MTKLTCPWCERSVNLDQLEMADLFRERNDLAAELGRAWRLANEYVDCFRAKRGGRITLKKRVRILREIAKLWRTCEFQYDGRRYSTRQEQVLEGLTAACNRDLAGLDNHNYLKKVLLASARKLSAEGLTATEEESREQRRLFGVRRRHEQKQDDDRLPAEDLHRRYGEFLKEF